MWTWTVKFAMPFNTGKLHKIAGWKLSCIN
jgi:hypothetical protein